MDRKSLVRLIITIVLIGGLIIIGRLSGSSEYAALDNLRESLESLGWLGIGFFFVALTVGELIWVPGLVFVAAATLVYGPVTGGLLAYAGAIVSVTVSFLVVRFIGGKPFAEIKMKFFAKMMAKLERRPILTVAILRVPLALLPPLNYALALSPIRFRDYLIGSAIGLYFPVAGTVLMTHFGVNLGM